MCTMAVGALGTQWLPDSMLARLRTKFLAEDLREVTLCDQVVCIVPRPHWQNPERYIPPTAEDEH